MLESDLFSLPNCSRDEAMRYFENRRSPNFKVTLQRFTFFYIKNYGLLLNATTLSLPSFSLIIFSNTFSGFGEYFRSFKKFLAVNPRTIQIFLKIVKIYDNEFILLKAQGDYYKYPV